MYQRKTADVYTIDSYYDTWYIECKAESKADAKRLLTEYNNNVPATPHRIVKHRELIAQ